MVGEVFAGYQGFKSIFDGLKALSDMRDEHKRIAAVIEIQRQFLELQSDYSALLQRNRELEDALAKKGGWEAETTRYMLTQVGKSAVYMLKPEAREGAVPHWLCANCFENGKKAHLQYSSKMSHIGNIYRCPQCKGHVTTHSEPAW